MSDIINYPWGKKKKKKRTYNLTTLCRIAYMVHKDYLIKQCCIWLCMYIWILYIYVHVQSKLNYLHLHTHKTSQDLRKSTKQCRLNLIFRILLKGKKDKGILLARWNMRLSVQLILSCGPYITLTSDFIYQILFS